MTRIYSISVKGLTPPFDPEATAYFTAAGITDATAKTLINAFIVGVKSDLSLSLLTDAFDQMFMPANESAGAAVVDMCGRVNAALVNSPTFTQWRGVKVNGLTDYINTNFNATVDAVHYTQNSKCASLWLRAKGSNTQNLYGCCDAGFAGTQVWGNDGSGNFAFLDSNASIYTTSPGTSDLGLLTLSRTASNLTKGYSGTTLVGSDTSGPIALKNLKMYLLSRNGNGSQDRTQVGTEVSFLAHLRGLSPTEVAAFYARVNTMLTGIFAL